MESHSCAQRHDIIGELRRGRMLLTKAAGQAGEPGLLHPEEPPQAKPRSCGEGTLPPAWSVRLMLGDQMGQEELGMFARARPCGF